MNLLYINLGKDGESATSQAVRMDGINPVDKTMDIISYPCDLWVSTPSLVSDYTISAIRLCSLIQLIKNTPGTKYKTETASASTTLILKRTPKICIVETDTTVTKKMEKNVL